MSVVLWPSGLPHDPFSIVRSIFFAATLPGIPEYLNRERAPRDATRGIDSPLLVETRSDADLIAQVLAGHSDAYAILVDRHRDRCYRFAVRLLGDRDDADEALQSAFVRAFRGLAGCRNRDHLSGWLLQIVRNECRTIAGRRAKRAQRFVRDEDELNRVSTEQPAASTAMLEEIQY